MDHLQRAITWGRHPACGGLVGRLSRREFIALGTAEGAGGALEAAQKTASRRPILIAIVVLFDRGGHSAKGLTESERALFRTYQEKARREYAVSGILFDVRVREDAYLRQQGYSEIPSQFLARDAINLFVTDALGYDIDRDRTGGVSMGPPAPSRRSAGDPFYKTFLGLKDARATTLPHEYAHQFTLDTLKNPSAASNLWADLRNDYWLWLQRRGMPIVEFRACAKAPWARLA